MSDKTLTVQLPFIINPDEFIERAGGWHCQVMQGTNANAVTAVKIGIFAGKSTTVSLWGGYFTDAAGSGTDATKTLTAGANTLYIKMYEKAGYMEVADSEVISALGGGFGDYFFNQGASAESPYHIIDIGRLPYSNALQKTIAIGGNNVVNGNINYLPPRSRYGQIYINISNTYSRVNECDIYGDMTSTVLPGLASGAQFYFRCNTQSWRGASIDTASLTPMATSSQLLLYSDNIQLKGNIADLKSRLLNATLPCLGFAGTFADIPSSMTSFTVGSAANSFEGDFGDITAPLTTFSIVANPAKSITYSTSRAWAANMVQVYVNSFVLSDADAERLLTDLNNTTWASGSSIYIKCNLTSSIQALITSLQGKGVAVSRTAL
ncbi:hypothetical protein FACS1894169_01180 [Bacteroidia bacterium]|nr:hypothetical protein FACS1894169_01180 [Bacteroidia bacterium]